MAALPALPPAALRAVLARHRVILGSKSASRQTLLRELGVPYEVVVRALACLTPPCGPHARPASRFARVHFSIRAGHSAPCARAADALARS